MACTAVINKSFHPKYAHLLISLSWEGERARPQKDGLTSSKRWVWPFCVCLFVCGPVAQVTFVHESYVCTVSSRFINCTTCTRYTGISPISAYQYGVLSVMWSIIRNVMRYSAGLWYRMICGISTAV